MFFVIILDYTKTINNVSADGITYSFGIFMVELIDVFKAGHGAASLIPSILVGVTLGSGNSAKLIFKMCL